MPPARKAAVKQYQQPAVAAAEVVPPPKPTLPPSPSAISTILSLPARALRDPVGTTKTLLFDRSHFWPFALLLTAFNLVLGVAIILRVPCGLSPASSADTRHQD